MAAPSAGPWHVPGKWFVGPSYWAQEVQDELKYRPSRVYIKDDTLREGEETPGVVFTLQDRVEIAYRLQEIGVAEIEMPMASSPEEQGRLMRAMEEAGVKLSKSFLAGGITDWKNNVDKAVAFGAELITLLFAYPQPEGFPSGGQSRDPKEALDGILRAIDYTKSKGVKVAYGSPGASRVPVQMVVDFNSAAAKAGASRVHVYDSRGIGMPAGISYLVRRVKEAVGDIPVLFHCHNDLGMATANTLAAVEGGAEWVDVVVNGLGDRAGNAALEEVVMGLEVHGVSTGIKLEKLFELSQFIQDKSGVTLQPNKAIVGRHSFLEESAAHFVGTKTAEAGGVPEQAAPYVPELVGRSHELVIGSTSLYGGALEYKLNEWGYKYSEEQLEEIRNRAAMDISVKRVLTEDEFQSICQQVLR